MQNSAARTYTQSAVRMGVVLDPALTWEVRYSIEAGNSEGIFQVGWKSIDNPLGLCS